MKQLKSTGIQLKFAVGLGWSAAVDFSSWEHAASDGIGGSIGPSCVGELGVAIDLAKQAAEAIGVSFEEPCLYIDEEGEHWPDDWRECVKRQSDRLGWRFPDGDRPLSIDTAVTSAERSR